MFSRLVVVLWRAFQLGGVVAVLLLPSACDDLAPGQRAHLSSLSAPTEPINRSRGPKTVIACKGCVFWLGLGLPGESNTND